MREMARQAGVQPATMTRLAHFIGAAGYEDLRREQADAIRLNGGLTQVPATSANAMLASGLLEGLAAQVLVLRQPQILDELLTVAGVLGRASRIFVMGDDLAVQQLRQIRPPGDVGIIDLQGPQNANPILTAGPEDVLLILGTVSQTAIRTARDARARQAKVIVLGAADQEPQDHENLDGAITSPALIAAVTHVICGLIAAGKGVQMDGAAPPANRGDGLWDHGQS